MTRFLGVTGLVLTVAALATASPPDSLGRKIASFSLPDYQGKTYSLSDFADREVVVVVFLGTECPLARLYAPRLEELSKEYADKKVAFIGIDSNQQDSIQEIAHYAKEHGVSFPLLCDRGNAIADQFGARRTPEAYVLDKGRTIRYVGRIDDQYGIGTTSGYAKTELRKQYVVAAVEELLAGNAVSEPFMNPPGCLIGRRRTPNEASEVTYSNQISRLLQKHCEECHRPGQIAPFALQDYDEVVGWAEMIEEVVRGQRMPPWHADPKFGHFRNDRSMSPEEKELIYTWVKNGAPRGNPAELPQPITYTNEWQIPNPDEIFFMSDKPYELPATGTLEYEYFEVDPGWTEDKWLQASECRIDNRSVVHHIFVFSIPPGVHVPDFEKNREERRQAAREGRRPQRPDDGFNPGTGGIELIAGAAPGTPPWMYGDGMATHLKAGTRLLFQMHYTPNGTETKDRTAVSFVYADPEEVRNNVRMTMAINPQFVIPAGAEAHPVEAFYAFHQDSLVLTMAPHMHLRGKSFRYNLEYPDGTKETILNVPQYDFNWQVIYMNAEPKFVPAGTRMHCEATFDNSLNNLANPDPTQEVRWGDQTWEEMMIGWFAISDDIDSGSIDPEYSRTKRFLASVSDKPLRYSLLLKKSAKSALESEIKMDTLYRQIKKVVPQVDRICVSTVADDKVVFLGASQPPVLDHVVGRVDRTYPADGAELAKYPISSSVIVNPKLELVTASDIATMAKRLRSSLHIPVVIDGKAATVNFWSREAEAFPEPAVEYLTEVGHLISGEKTTVSQK